MQVSDLRHQAASAVTTAAITPRGKLLSEFTHRPPLLLELGADL